MQKFVIPFKAENDKQKCIEVKSKSALLKKRAVKTWTTEEDQKLIALYHQYPKKWNIISEKMLNRNQNQCLHRFRRICQLGQNKKIWSVHEDQTVLKMISKVGHNWKLIAQALGSKSGKQIRERFINKLDPSIRREEWTEQEDLKIIELYAKLGSKWCEISKRLKGRPENRIKNRFYSYIQKNYEFNIKQNDNQSNDKQNALTAGVKLIQRKDIDMGMKKPLGRLLEQNLFFQQQFYDNKVKVETDECKLQQRGFENIRQDQEQFQAQSLKQINQQCFFDYTQRGNNNDELLYFEDDN